MLNTGFKFAGTGVSVNTDSNPWLNPANILGDDAFDSITAELDNTTSDYLLGRGFGFNVPIGAVILGVEMRNRKWSDAELAITSTTYRLRTLGVPRTARSTAGDWPAEKEADTQGGPSDTWDTVLTPEIVNLSNFGSQLQVKWDNAESGAGDAHVDSIEMNIYYRLLPGGAAGSQLTTLGS